MLCLMSFSDSSSHIRAFFLHFRGSVLEHEIILASGRLPSFCEDASDFCNRVLGPKNINNYLLKLDYL